MPAPSSAPRCPSPSVSSNPRAFRLKVHMQNSVLSKSNWRHTAALKLILQLRWSALPRKSAAPEVEEVWQSLVGIRRRFCRRVGLRRCGWSSISTSLRCRHQRCSQNNTNTTCPLSPTIGVIWIQFRGKLHLGMGHAGKAASTPTIPVDTPFMKLQLPFSTIQTTQINHHIPSDLNLLYM
jgi:hypothetical protein